jgi:hypothetical protein
MTDEEEDEWLSKLPEDEREFYKKQLTEHCDAGDHPTSEGNIRWCPVCGFSACFGHRAELEKHKALITKQHRHVSVEMVVAFCIIMQNGEGIISKSPSYIKEKWDQYLRRSEFDNLKGIFDSENQKKFEEWLSVWEEYFEENESIETI